MGQGGGGEREITTGGNTATAEREEAQSNMNNRGSFTTRLETD